MEGSYNLRKAGANLTLFHHHHLLSKGAPRIRRKQHFLQKLQLKDDFILGCSPGMVACHCLQVGNGFDLRLTLDLSFYTDHEKHCRKS